MDDQRTRCLNKGIVDMKNTMQNIVPHTLPSQSLHRGFLTAMVTKVTFKFGSAIFANHLLLVIKNRETKIHRHTLLANKQQPEFSKIVRRAVWPAVTAQPDIALHGRHRPLVLQLTASALFGLFRSKPLIQNMMYYRPFELMTN